MNMREIVEEIENFEQEYLKDGERIVKTSIVNDWGTDLKGKVELALVHVDIHTEEMSGAVLFERHYQWNGNWFFIVEETTLSSRFV